FSEKSRLTGRYSRGHSKDFLPDPFLAPNLSFSDTHDVAIEHHWTLSPTASVDEPNFSPPGLLPSNMSNPPSTRSVWVFHPFSFSTRGMRRRHSLTSTSRAATIRDWLLMPVAPRRRKPIRSACWTQSASLL